MAADDTSGARPGPIVLRIKLRYDDVEQMVQRFAANVGKSGLFLPTRSLQPIGAEVKFELRLADDTPALVGLGRVKSSRAPDPQHPRAAFGMAIELMRVTPQSRALILRMLERRRELGLPEVALPSAADIDTARRAEGVDPMGRELATGPVPVVAAAEPAPRAPRPIAATPFAAAPSAAGSSAGMPIAPPPPGDALLTAPRRTTGPMLVAKVVAIAPLAPEPPRRRRPAVNEVIERASGPVAAVAVALPGLDDDVDLAATIARARALAGGSLDAELEALSERAAAPVAISIEAASAELARQLGGSSVRRDRSAGWAPPPATAMPAAPAPDAADDADADAAAVSGPDGHAPDEADARASGPDGHAPDEADARASGPDEERPDEGNAGAAGSREAIPAPMIEPNALDASAPGFDAAEAPELPPMPGADEPEPGLDAAPAAWSPSDEPEPGLDAAPAAWSPSDEPEPGLDAAPAAWSPSDEPESGPDAAPAAWSPSDDDRVELALAELDSDEHTEMGGMPGAAGFELPAEAELGVDDPDLGAPPPDGMDGAGQAEPPLELGVDEFDDFEILAEADANDEDLLASHGEHDASSRRDIDARLDAGLDAHRDAYPGRRASTGPSRPSELDFAARLDLGDESDGHVAAAASDEFSARHVIEALQDELTSRHPGGYPGPRSEDLHALSAGAALAAFEGDEAFEDDSEVTDDPDAHDRQPVQPIFDPDPSSSFTLAGIPSDSIDYTPSPPHRDPPRLVDPPRPVERRAAAPSRPEPSTLRHAPLPAHDGPVEDHELEHALEALDVDLDDLSIPHAATQLQRPAGARAKAPTPQSQPQSLPRAAAPTPAPQPRTPAPTPAPQPRSKAPTPGPQPRGFASAPAPQRTKPSSSAPQPQPRAKVVTPAPQPRASAATPSRPLGHGTNHPARTAIPRTPSEDGVDIDFDDDD